MNEDDKRLVRRALMPMTQLWIKELEVRTDDIRNHIAVWDSQHIAEKAETLFLQPARPEPSVLTAIARVVAIRAYRPEGVTMLGIHACVREHAGCPAGNTEDGSHDSFGHVHEVEE